MKAPKAFLTVLIAGFLIFTQFFICEAFVAASAAPDIDKVATTFVDFLRMGKFEDAVKLFNIEMAEALPPQKLEAMWNELIGRHGEFKGMVGTRITEEGGYRVVYVACEFAETSLDIKVVFDEEAKIAGLWLVPAKTEGLHGIYIAALISTGISGIWIGLVYWLSERRWKYIALMAITIPFSAIVNLWVKKPIFESLTSFLSIPPGLSTATPWWFLLLALFLAPVTEEAIKLSPLAPRPVRGMVNRSSALWMGMAFGMGFGIGEIWYLAWRFSMVPEYAGYPFWYFGGFIGERMLCVFIHGVLTAVAVTGFMKGRRGLLIGYVGAIFLHAFVNVGAMLYQIGFWDVTLAFLYLIFSFIILLTIFEHLHKRALKDQKRVEVILFSRE